MYSFFCSMCGIFWFIWKGNAPKILIHGLEKLEYRWYDSAGFFAWNESEWVLVKSVGKVSKLSEKAEGVLEDWNRYTYGIAHTRWATHGGVTEENCHPHYSQNEEYYLVHNGIIENYASLRRDLEEKGYQFYGQTDSEVIAKLIEDASKGSLIKTIEDILPQLEWAYAFLFVSKKDPNEMIAIKYGSPLIFGHNDEKTEFYFSSDAQALAGIVKNILFLDDGELVHVKNGDFTIKSEWKLIRKPLEILSIEHLKSEKGDFEHFMLKEIYEQPSVLREVFRWRVDFENSRLIAHAFEELDQHEFEKITFIACGTSYHAGWLGSYWFEDLTTMSTSVEVASEFAYKNIRIDPKTLYVFISQSGETADSIEPLKYLKSKWAHTFGIVNVVGSSISRLTDFWLFTRAGTEVWVASTKAFLAQITCVLLLALYFWERQWLAYQRYRQIIAELEHIPQKIEKMLQDTSSLQVIAKELATYPHCFFLGRHLELPIAYEASLKFKEISYNNSQALASGELKHGSLALIDENFPSVIFMPSNFLFEKNISSVQEIIARKGKILAISDEAVPAATWHISIEKTSEELFPFLSIIPAQLIAYYSALSLGRDIDRPRNLAKSVTVK